MAFIHVYLKQMRTRFDRKGRALEQSRVSQSFYDGFEMKEEGDWVVIKDKDGIVHRFPKDGIAEIVQGD